MPLASILLSSRQDINYYGPSLELRAKSRQSTPAFRGISYRHHSRPIAKSRRISGTTAQSSCGGSTSVQFNTSKLHSHRHLSTAGGSRSARGIVCLVGTSPTLDDSSADDPHHRSACQVRQAICGFMSTNIDLRADAEFHSAARNKTH